MFKEQLQKAMNQQSLTQSGLSAKTGIGKSSISQYLSGKNVPHKSVKQKLADALEVTVDYFDEQSTDEPTDVTKNVPVWKAAEMMGASKQFVRVALQKGIAPFGFAVKLTGGKYTYHISPKKLNEYMGVC